MTAREAAAETEVPVPVEAAWEAVATGPGISAWFHPFDVEERVGGDVSMDTGAGLTRIGEVTAYEPPRRFAYLDDPFAPADDLDPVRLTTESLVEPAGEERSRVRVATSGFGDGEAWEAFRHDVRFGWEVALVGLRLRLEHWPDAPHASLFADARTTQKAHAEVWSRLSAGLGIPASVDVGEALRSGPDAPSFCGEVTAVFDEWIVLRTDEPAPGFLHIGAHEQGGAVAARLDATFYGERAGAVAQREGERWRAWLEACVG